MSECCTPRGYRRVFSERSARAEARRYRRKGLDATSRRIFELLRGQGVEGRSVLEVGGGIGALQIELLKAGAANAVSVELTPTYEEAAASLLRENGLAERVERRVVDFVEAAGTVAPADIVVMNRVVCCYPDMPALAGAAADHARRSLVMSFPRRTWWTVGGLALANAIFAATRREFHIFVHRPSEIVAAARRHGLEPSAREQGALWTVAAMRRASP
jgi:2-polyprenyl-3-methyl-5-hydroxy-6-metoxy-1,4-benzoquinol methylase